jgi:hypothetical protein
MSCRGGESTARDLAAPPTARTPVRRSPDFKGCCVTPNDSSLYFILCSDYYNKCTATENLSMTATASDASGSRTRHFGLGMAAYLVPTFVTAFVWHLVLFEQSYHALGIYRRDPIIPFGFASMIIQGAVFSWAFPRLFSGARSSALKDGLLFGAAAGLLSWSFTTLAVAAKHPMTSIPDYFALETSFSLLQFVIVGPLIAVAYRT